VPCPRTQQANLLACATESNSQPTYVVKSDVATFAPSSTNKKARNMEKLVLDPSSVHHDNAPTHAALNIQQYLACGPKQHSTARITPYSPDLAPCDFFVSQTKGNH